jgi:hypothetical protein
VNAPTSLWSTVTGKEKAGAGYGADKQVTVDTADVVWC